MWEAGVAVIGPGWTILARTGDKLKAKLLAEECHVPTLPALTSPTNNIEDLRTFASKTGYPIMVKAVDGGGGRGIRLIRSEDALEAAAKRAVEESPSKLVFAEKAAVDGYLHVEIQIIGDGKGGIRHLWERQCSIQRRFQKVVEIAPCLTKNRKFIGQIIEAAVKMARQVSLIWEQSSDVWINIIRSTTSRLGHSNSWQILSRKTSTSSRSTLGYKLSIPSPSLSRRRTLSELSFCFHKERR